METHGGAAPPGARRGGLSGAAGEGLSRPRRGGLSGEQGEGRSRALRRGLSRAVPAGVLLVGVAAAGLVGAAEPEAKVSEEEGARHFAEAAAVLQHARCRNCHPAGDAPLHGDDGHPHAMHVSRASTAAGLNCTTCHRGKNTDFEHGPPGVPDWHMPPAETKMVFEGLSVAELCGRLKDPSKNGGRSLSALVEHVGHDPLVLWAWSPGPGRSKPPITHEAFVEHVRKWAAAGGPCPAGK